MRSTSRTAPIIAAVLLCGCQAIDKLDKAVATWGPEGTGVQFVNVPKAVRILATYKATPAQKVAARGIAVAAQATLEAEKQAEQPAKRPKKIEVAPVEAREGILPPVEPEKPAATTAATTRLDVRYLAVEVPPKKDEPVAEGKTNVMFWDTHFKEFVGEDVYVIEKAPKMRSVTKWDTFTTQFVGAGL